MWTIEDKQIFWIDGEKVVKFDVSMLILSINSTYNRDLIPTLGHENLDMPKLAIHGIFNWKELSKLRGELLKLDKLDRNTARLILLLDESEFPLEFDEVEVPINFYPLVEEPLTILYRLSCIERVTFYDIKRYLLLLDRCLLNMKKESRDIWANLCIIDDFPDSKLGDIVDLLRKSAPAGARNIASEFKKNYDKKISQWLR